MSLEAISSHPTVCYLGEETDLHLATASFQVGVDRKVLPEPPFLQAEQAQLPSYDVWSRLAALSGYAPVPQPPSCSEGSAQQILSLASNLFLPLYG